MSDLKEAGAYFIPEWHTSSLSGGPPGSAAASPASRHAVYPGACVGGRPGSMRIVCGSIQRMLAHSRANGFAGVAMAAKTTTGDTALQLDGYLFDARSGWPASC